MIAVILAGTGLVFCLASLGALNRGSGFVGYLSIAAACIIPAAILINL